MIYNAISVANIRVALLPQLLIRSIGGGSVFSFSDDCKFRSRPHNCCAAVTVLSVDRTAANLILLLHNSRNPVGSISPKVKNSTRVNGC